MKNPMILMIDNYDSFTYNLVQQVLAAGVEVEVVRNDVETAVALIEREPDGIIISPGPGRPEEAGVCPELVDSRTAMAQLSPIASFVSSSSSRTRRTRFSRGPPYSSER